MNSTSMQENNQVFRKECRRILHSGDAKGVAGICFNKKARLKPDGWRFRLFPEIQFGIDANSLLT